MPVWWNEGLPFACTQCGKCCHARDGYAHVVLNRREQLRLARHLGLPLREFLSRYTETDADGHVGLRFEEGRCVMLDGAACSVHEAKPTQCRTWPFWPELLASRAAYEREVRSFCPGSRSGPIVPAAAIRSQLLQIEAADSDAAEDARRRR
jgi:Fe-S-cluster containining protein